MYEIGLLLDAKLERLLQRLLLIPQRLQRLLLILQPLQLLLRMPQLLLQLPQLLPQLLQLPQLPLQQTLQKEDIAKRVVIVKRVAIAIAKIAAKF
jgi:hypothetical protein